MARARGRRRTTGEHLRSVPSRESIEVWLAARRRTIAIVIVGLAIVVRALYYGQLSATPVAKLQQAPETDMSYYDEWARQIAAGDWLSRRVTVPSHHWHREVARIYRATHGVQASGPDDSPAEAQQNAALWTAWMHSPAFYQDPLYAYGVAAIYRATGDDTRFVFLLQLLAGVASVWLVWAIACRAFDDLVALIAGILAVLCAPLLFYELLLLRDSLLVCAGLLITWLLLQPETREHAWAAGRFGLAIGIGALLKSTLLLFGVAALLGMLYTRSRSRQLAMVVAGIAIGGAPLVVRNIVVGAPPLASATSGPLTFVSANDANYPPDVGFGVDPALLARFLGDTPGGWADAVRLVAASQSLTGYGAQLWDKWTRAWQWYEIPNNENFYEARRVAPILWWLPITMGSLAPLALVGLVLAAPQIRDRWPLFAAVGVTLLPLLLFYVLGRFRVSLLACSIPFAAKTIADGMRHLARAKYARAALLAAAVWLVAAWTGQALGPHEVLLRPSDWILPFSVYYEAPIEAAASERQFGRAAQLYADYFTRYEPSPGDAHDSPGLAAVLATMHRQCADLFDAAGDRAAAIQQRAAADRLASQ